MIAGAVTYIISVVIAYIICCIAIHITYPNVEVFPYFKALYISAMWFVLFPMIIIEFIVERIIKKG